MQIDDKLKGLIKDLGDAINEALAQSVEIGTAIQNVRNAGYDVVLALDLVGKNDFNLHIERSVGHIDLQAFLADRRHMFFIDIDKSHILAGARKPAADNAADGTGADNQYAVAHPCLPFLKLQRHQDM